MEEIDAPEWKFGELLPANLLCSARNKKERRNEKQQPPMWYLGYFSAATV